MTASAKNLSEIQVWELAPSLRSLQKRVGAPPHLDAKWPCLQDEDRASPALLAAIAAFAGTLPGST
ncbi:hypothetical protein, partial [Klebsiella oxytoca]